MAAAEARSRAPAPPVSSAATAHSDVPFVPSRLDKLAFHRLIDTEVRACDTSGGDPDRARADAVSSCPRRPSHSE